MTGAVKLTHFIRGEVEVIPVINEGRREWIEARRPMMRPWDRCIFREPADQVDALHQRITAKQSKEGAGDAARLFSLA